MINQFIQFGLILLVVFGVSLVIRLLKQPLIIGYIISGILVGPLFFNLINGSETISVFSEMGIAFLLFIVGLHLSPKVIKEVGKVSLVTGLGQIIFTSIIGYFIGVMLGFSVITSIYIAIALTFSSTIIIMKLLSDKDALEKLYGKISIGFLLVQDLAAILILIVVSSLSNGTNVSNLFFSTILKGLAIVALLIPIAYYFLPKMEDFFAKSQEFLFIFSLSWGFALAMLFLYAGFSIEVGALIAIVLMGLLGYSKKTGFMAGLTVAQISEFSLILIALGVRVGHLSNEILSFVTLIGLITIAGSTYMIIYSDSIYNKISKSLSIFERKDIQEKKIAKKNYKYILLGHNRIGFSIIKAFSRITNNFLVVDYNPEIVRDLRKMRIRAVYGDVDDSEFLEDIGISKASLIVSTVPDIETNHLILDVLKRNKSSAIKILTARQISDAVELYNSGADYVILPHFLGGEYTAKLIRGAKDDKSVYEKEKIKELKILKERFLKKQDHPEVEKD